MGAKMEASYSYYDYEKSIVRINETLDASDSLYEEKKSIPTRSSLTYSNGYYVSCSALFVDIRESKSLNERHKRPTLAKIYKTYISEVVAVMRSHTRVNEIYIEGDCVWGVFDTPYQSDVNELFCVAAQISSLIDILNIRYKKKGYSELTVGIGASYGESLYIKAGHSGSGINEVVWLGKLVGEAAELCSFGNKESYDSELMVSNVFYDNLEDSNKKLLYKHSYRSCYHGYVINTLMNEWVKNNG
jgi:class 3 adenylate cyclase